MRRRSAVSAYDSTHSTVLGCLTSCQSRALTPVPSNSANCCSGAFDTPAKCPKENVQYYEVFKSNCPDAYAYACASRSFLPSLVRAGADGLSEV
ncbi:hypothetical protein EPN29_13715 [bacterium]|nr:MAG: hypothetical protein EPN29_13715 [bacterium]